MKSYLFCLCVCHLKIIFCICICICNFVFLEGGNKAKKNFEVLDDIFWRGKTKKTVRLIEIQSLRSITLWYECSHIKIESNIKADKGATEVPSFQTSYFSKLCSATDQGGACALFIWHVLAWPPRACPVQYSAHGIWDKGQGTRDIRNQGRYSQVHFDLIIIIGVLLGYFLAQWEQKLRAKPSNCTQSDPEMLIIFHNCGWLHSL